MKCLIIAAGRGERLRHIGGSKPLIPILGVPLIERVIRSAHEAGVNDFYVVIGYQGEKVRTFLDRLTERSGIGINTILNEDWDKENGFSVLKAQKYLHEPFLLLMADHLFDPAILSELMALPLADGEITLAVDGNMGSSFIDLEDVTRVITKGGRVQDIGKGLSDFNGFDTGIFVCTPAIFRALECCMGEYDDTTISRAVQIMAVDGRTNAFDIGDRLWIDIDNEKTLIKAESKLLPVLTKASDGPVSRYLNRPISLRITRYIWLKTDLTPNSISIFSFLLSLSAAFFFFTGGILQPGYWSDSHTRIIYY